MGIFDSGDKHPAATDVMPDASQLAPVLDAFNGTAQEIRDQNAIVLRAMQQLDGHALEYETFTVSLSQSAGEAVQLIGYDLSRMALRIWTSGAKVYVGKRAEIAAGNQGYRLIPNNEHAMEIVGALYVWVGDDTTAGPVTISVFVEKSAQ